MSDFLEYCCFVLNLVARNLGVPRRLFYLENPIVIKEALQQLESQANRAATPQPVAAALRNATLVAINGQTQRINHEPQPRRHKVASLDSLATLVNGPGGKGTPARDRASVWHYGNLVIAVLDDGDESFRDDRAEWQLNGSVKFGVLTKQAGQLRGHKAFVEFVVENLRDEMEAAHPGLLGTLRKLRFISNSEATGNVQHGKASYGRSVEEEVAGATALPETIVFNVKRWADLEFVIEVECLLKVDPGAGEFALVPLADELQAAENAAHAWLHEQLTAELECPIYYGSP